MEVAPSKKISSMHRPSLTSNSSKTHKGQTKHRPINKAQKPHSEQFRLNKNTSFAKTERKGGHKHKSHHQQVKKSEVQKAFALHSMPLLGEQQCLFSLKMLGCLGVEEAEGQKFRALWREKGLQSVDLTTFQQIHSKLYSKENHQNKKDLFSILSCQRELIDKTALDELAKLVDWKGDTSKILKGLQSNNGLNFEEFSKITNRIEALQ